jgi:hypothetical protein
MANNSRPDTPSPKNDWTRPGFIAAGAVVLLIVILGVILALTGGSAGREPGRAETTPAAHTEAANSDIDSSICGLPAGMPTVPSNPPRARWELVGQMAAPTAPATKGPGRVDNGLRSCFAHSPVGVLYAAVNVVAMTAKDDLRAPFIRRMTVPGVGRDRAIATLGQEPSTAQDSSTALQVAGFAIKDYRQRSAVVDLAFRVDTGNAAGYVHLSLAMRWLDGDWKLALPDTGRPFDGMTRITNLTGYVPWKGV